MRVEGFLDPLPLVVELVEVVGRRPGILQLDPFQFEKLLDFVPAGLIADDVRVGLDCSIGSLELRLKGVDRCLDPRSLRTSLIVSSRTITTSKQTPLSNTLDI